MISKEPNLGNSIPWDDVILMHYALDPELSLSFSSVGLRSPPW